MTSLVLAALLQISVLSAPSDNYAQAYQATQESGKPLVVLVGADWCPGCQAMQNSTMPEVANHGDLKNVSYAHVNCDREKEVANGLMAGNRIPQLVKYTKTADGWNVDRLIGAQSAQTVEDFLAPAPTPTTHTVSSVEAR